MRLCTSFQSLTLTSSVKLSEIHNAAVASIIKVWRRSHGFIEAVIRLKMYLQFSLIDVLNTATQQRYHVVGLYLMTHVVPRMGQ